MKQKLVKIAMVLLFLCGFGFIAYPTVSNEWNTYVQSTIINDYEDVLADFDENDYAKEWKAAKDFNANIQENAIGSDYFETGAQGDAVEPTDTFLTSEYYKVLNVNGDGVMGYLSIPKINLKLPIMHGTFDKYLQKALGHMNGTALPIGGVGTHSVIVGHRGLPAAELFTNLDKMQIGDKFYIHVLNETLAYEVDHIEPMIEAEDLDALTSAMAVQPDKDYVTLFTCTPYGVNTHRLLIRGVRVEYIAEEETPIGTSAVIQTVHNYYLILAIFALILVIILTVIIRRVANKNNSIKK